MTSAFARLARGRLRAARAAPWLAAATLALGACAHVPVINEAHLLEEAAGTRRIAVYGAHGPLTARESRAVLARVKAQAPDADALERRLAVEQIVAESPLYAGNSVRVLCDGAQALPAIFDAIAGAKHFLYLEYYILDDVQSNGRRLGDLLIARSRAGVRVEVIYDAFGSIGTAPAFFERLRAAGVRVIRYNPVNPFEASARYAPNMRDHRKILVADDTVAIVGGVNLSREYESAPRLAKQPPPPKGAAAQQEVWHDIDIEIRGPVVPELSRLFRAHWRAQNGPPLEKDPPARSERPRGNQIVRILGSSPERLASRYYAAVLTAMRTARSSIWITAAYFVPTHQELRGLEAAARRGVDVRVLLPSHTDFGFILDVQRSYYPQLLRAGVKIYERNDGIVHSKTMVVDGVWSLVGSSNFDQRSVLFNDEVDTVILGKRTADELRAALESDQRHARRIGWAQVRSRGTLQRLKSWFWRLWKEML